MEIKLTLTISTIRQWFNQLLTLINKFNQIQIIIKRIIMLKIFQVQTHLEKITPVNKNNSHNSNALRIQIIIERY